MAYPLPLAYSQTVHHLMVDVECMRSAEPCRLVAEPAAVEVHLEVPGGEVLSPVFTLVEYLLASVDGTRPIIRDSIVRSWLVHSRR